MTRGDLAFVFVGGAAGTAARAALEQAFGGGTGGRFPWATLGINLIGALALGFLLQALVARPASSVRARAARFGAGTGLLGGFTTYSTFAVETLDLTPSLAMVYALGTVLFGAIAAYLGARLGRLVAREGRR